MSLNQPLFLVAQKDIRVEAPDRPHLFSMGTVSGVPDPSPAGQDVRVMVERPVPGQTAAPDRDRAPSGWSEVEQMEREEPYEGKTNSLRAEGRPSARPMSCSTVTATCPPKRRRRMRQRCLMGVS